MQIRDKAGRGAEVVHQPLDGRHRCDEITQCGQPVAVLLEDAKEPPLSVELCEEPTAEQHGGSSNIGAGIAVVSGLEARH